MSVLARDLEQITRAAAATTTLPFPMYPGPLDYQRGAVHALLICSVAKEQLSKLVEDSGIDARELKASIEAHLFDLGNEISGALHEAAERVEGERR